MPTSAFKDGRRSKNKSGAASEMCTEHNGGERERIIIGRIIICNAARCCAGRGGERTGVEGRAGEGRGGEEQARF